MATPLFDAALHALNGNLVFKFSSGGVYIADYATPCPTTVLTPDGLDFVVPAGFVFTGLTDPGGITNHRAMTATDLPAWQTTQTIRNDVDTDMRSLSVKLMENNIATIAIKEKQPIAGLAVKPGTAGYIDSPIDGAEPLRRVIWIAHDKKRDVFKGQILPQMSVSAPGDELIQRAGPNMTDITLNAYYDAAFGTDCRTFWGGAGWIAAGGTPTTTPGTPGV